MGTINHSEVVAASRHAPVNLTYTSLANLKAGTNEGNGIVLTAANLYQIGYESFNGTYWVLVNNDPITWRQILVFDTSNRMSFVVWEGGYLKLNSAPIELADGEYYDLPEDSAGCGTFFACEKNAATAPEVAQVHWNIDGSVTSMFLSTNAAVTDAASSLCVFDNGSTARVKNNLGYTVYLIFDLDYCLNYVS